MPSSASAYQAQLILCIIIRFESRNQSSFFVFFYILKSILYFKVSSPFHSVVITLYSLALIFCLFALSLCRSFSFLSFSHFLSLCSFTLSFFLFPLLLSFSVSLPFLAVVVTPSSLTFYNFLSLHSFSLCRYLSLLSISLYYTVCTVSPIQAHL